MPELSNMLRQRLGAANTATQTHPDADTLTAYVEQLLPTQERETISTHLAVCGDCREILALSQSPVPELEAQPVIKPAAVPAWRRFFTPGFGLAGMVAAMAVIAVVVIQAPQKSTQPPVQQAQQSIPAAPPQAEQNRASETNSPIPAQSAGIQSSRSDLGQTADSFVGESRENHSRPVASAPLARQAQPTRNEVTVQATRASMLATRGQRQDYVNTNLFAANNPDNAMVPDGSMNGLLSASSPQGRTNVVFPTKPENLSAFADIPQNANAKSNLGLLTPTPAPEHFNSILSKVAKNTIHGLRLHPGASSSPAIRSSILGNSAMGSPGMFSSSLQKDQMSTAAASDKVETSSLEKSKAFSGGTLSSYNARTASSQWKVADGKLLKMSDQLDWRDAHPVMDGSFEFSCVTARGGDVWAGGTHGALIHSRDGGMTWETIKLGDLVSGTVANISILSSAVQVKTSDDQIWLSVDGGKSWLVQNQN
jgi:hypothetical protein